LFSSSSFRESAALLSPESTSFFAAHCKLNYILESLFALISLSMKLTISLKCLAFSATLAKNIFLSVSSAFYF
jgi:hypothetical protein